MGDQETPFPLENIIIEKSYEKLPLPDCTCAPECGASTPEVIISERKQKILNTVARTEAYLRDRRIPELIRFLLTKIVSESPLHPVPYMERLLDDCMLFRAGHGNAPVLYEERHLRAVLKSFDPGQRGWLSTGQIRRVYNTLGFTSSFNFEEKTPIEEVLKNLVEVQELELMELLSAGISSKESSTSIINLFEGNT